MSTTRMRTANSTTIYHRIAASGDSAEHDVATNVSEASGLGSSADFQIDNDIDLTYVDGSQVINSTLSPLSGATSCTAFVFFKHSGYTTAEKTTTTNDGVKISFYNDIGNYFTLEPGESFIFHGLGPSLDLLSDFYVDSEGDDIYLEITCGSTSDE